MNVIAVDWSGGNQMPYYDQAVANTVLVAAVIRRLLQAMVDKGAQPEQVHLIGHSLGAQISGYVGHSFPNIGRISGLGMLNVRKSSERSMTTSFGPISDPAGPDFYVPPSERLDPTDAKFVDVIHTDAARNVHEGFGHEEPLGHVDFFPNGGSAQPSNACRQTTDLIKFYLSLIDSLWRKYFQRLV